MRDFHKKLAGPGRQHPTDPNYILARKRASRAASAKTYFFVCTIFGHRPVDGVHSIENTCVTKVDFPLTELIEGVQQDRSLTAS
jgi:hypothetical protein